MLKAMNTNLISRSIPFTFAPVENLWVVPAGEYRARVKTVTVSPCKTDRSKQVYRFVFDVIEDVNGPVNKLAKKDYTSGTPSYDQLQNDLTAFFDASEVEAMRGTRTEVDLSALVGRDVDLLISTFTAKGHVEPYSKIDRVERPGKYIPDIHGDFANEDLALAI
jgi:hypothetical protein